jgi:hypothetical protein
MDVSTSGSITEDQNSSQRRTTAASTTAAPAPTCSTANFLATVSSDTPFFTKRDLMYIIDCAMARIVDFAAPLGQKAGPGKWNDLDMLEVRSSFP